jgi:hypothetical protein
MAMRFIALMPTFFIVLSAQAAETLQTKGNLAAFYSLTTSGCISTNRFLLLADESSRTNGGGGDARRTLYVTEYDYDSCLGLEVRSATGSKDLERSEFMMSTSTARLMTSIEMQGTLGVESRNVDLTWSATEKTWSGTYTTQYNGPGFMVLTRYNGSSRSAIVSGTLGNEGVNTAGAMDTVKTGTVTITRK